VLLQTSAELLASVDGLTTISLASHGQSPASASFLEVAGGAAAEGPKGNKKRSQDTFLVGALRPPKASLRLADTSAVAEADTIAASNDGSDSKEDDSIEASESESASIRPTSLARSAPLTEDGYQSVVAEHSDEEMKAYIRRVLAANGLGVNKSNEGSFAGLVPYFSGTKAAQSLKGLQKELQNAPWVVRISAFVAESLMNGASGASAPLTEAGYQLVTAMRSDAEMEVFMRRMLEEDQVMPDNADAKRIIQDLAPHYSGTVAEQNLAQLRKDLLFHLPFPEEDESENNGEGSSQE
jgi:hypothetical protein